MKKLGFTLAEVLITLVIIGVIAAMTIPTLMNNTNANEYRSALKKAMSSVNQALETEYALEGLTAADFDSSTIVSDLFEKRLQTINSTASVTGAVSPVASFTTADGAIFTVTENFSGVDDENNAEGSSCDFENTTPCGTGPNLYIDVNGLRKPNQHTITHKRPRDIYQATIYSQKVLPHGEASQGVMFDKPSANE